MSRITLVGCGRSKREAASRAERLYTGGLTHDRIEYAKRVERPWFIISAGHGLVAPDVEIAPYDATLATMRPVDQVGWAVGIVHDLLGHLADDWQPDRSTVVELHAGAAYASRLIDLFRAAGFSTDWPLQGMGIGQQRKWYSEQRQWKLTGGAR